MTIGERIKIVRKQCKETGITQKELGAMCDIDAANIRKYESNRQNPKIETITKIANALDVPVSLLMGEQPFPDPFLQSSKALVSVCEAINTHHHVMISDLPFTEKIRAIETMVEKIDFCSAPNSSADEVIASVVIFKEYRVIDTMIDTSQMRSLHEITDPDELKRIIIKQNMRVLSDRFESLKNALSPSAQAERDEHVQSIIKKFYLLSETQRVAVEKLLDAMLEDAIDNNAASED